MQDTCAVVIVAAGTSRRMQGRDKLWSPLAGRVILARTIDAFEASPVVTAIVLVVHPERLDEARALCRHERWNKTIMVVEGGSRRQDSVRMGLDKVAASIGECHYVMIHDGARPFVSLETLDAGMKAVLENRAVIAAVPVKDTIKKVETGIISGTLDRSQLWLAQTPQIFSFPLIHQAHHSTVAQHDVTDDASLLQRLGHTVKIFPGSYTNIKITTQDDMLLAEALLRGNVL